MKKQDFIKGSIILMLSAAIAKMLGALFKIPLTNMLGGVGMGYFSCAYSLFLPIYALTVTGLSSAVARLTAQSTALEMYENAKKVRKTALKLFFAAGLAGSIIIAVLARPFSVYVAKSPDAWISVTLIAPSVLFGCIMAVERGYYEGLCNMYPTAFSQLAEGLVKMLAGLFFCSLVNQNSQLILNYLPDGTDIRAAAAGAGIFGVTLSSVGAALFFPIMRIFLPKENKCGDKTLIKTGDISKELISIALPIGISSVVTNLTAIIDLGTLIGCIDMFKGHYVLPEGTEHSDLPQFIYGSFSGIAVTVFNLVPSITNMLGKGILPAITCAWERHDKAAMKKSTLQALTASAFMAVPAAVGLGVLSAPVLNFLFPKQPEEVAVCIKALQFLMPGMVCLCVSFPVFSMLQAIGKPSAPLKIMLIGALVKLAGNILLIPFMGVDGSALSTSICYAVILILSLFVYLKTANIKLSAKPFISIAYSGLICGICAMLCHDRFSYCFSDTISLFLSVGAGGFGYLLMMYLCEYSKAKN